jgi:hypothetical protein
MSPVMRATPEFGNSLQVGSTAPTNPNGSTIDTNTSGLSAGMLSGQQLAGFQPENYSAFGNVPSVSATTYTSGSYDPATYASQGYNATNIDNSQLPGAMAMFDQQNATALAPQFQQQDMSLNDNLASRGIVNSGANTYLNQNLAGNQDAALAQADSPLTQQFAADYESNLSQNAAAQNAASQFNATAGNEAGQFNAASKNQAGQFNTGSGNSAAEFNAQAGNEAALANAGYYGTVVSGDQNAYNNYLNTLESQGNEYSNGLLSGFLGTYGDANSTALAGLNEGTSAATNAYGNAYNSSLAAGSGFGTALGNIASNAFNPASSTASTPGSGSDLGNPDNYDPANFNNPTGG